MNADGAAEAENRSVLTPRREEDRFKTLNPPTTRAPMVMIEKLPSIYGAKRDSQLKISTTIRPEITKSTVAAGQPKETNNDEDLKSGEPSELVRAIEESVRQQIEFQLSRNTTHGRMWSDELSSFFGQPVKLTASIWKPSSTTTSTRSPLLLL